MLLYSNENLLHMTCEQEKCYNLINGNDKILIIKKRQSGASSLLATYVISELQEGYNKTICYMSPSSLMNEHLMYSIIHHFSSIYNGNGIAKNTHKELKLLNGNRLICRLNTAESFCGEHSRCCLFYLRLLL